MKDKFGPANSDYVEWYANLLLNRKIEITMNGISVKRALRLGIAQGGTTSPMSWNLSIDKLLNKLNNLEMER